MYETPNWAQGAQYLSQVEPALAPYIAKYPPCPLRPQPAERYFEILVRAMLSQQVAPRVIGLIMGRLHIYCGRVTPENILAIETDAWLSMGVTVQKVRFVRTLAQLTLDRVIRLDEVDNMTDSAVLEHLLQVRGLGEWTVGMFQILALCRPDIMLCGDFNFTRAYQTLFALPSLPGNALLRSYTAHWSPWRTLGIWYLWQAYEILGVKDRKKPELMERFR